MSFFRQHKPAQLFGTAIDMAFLDGLHLYEFLLRDFVNTEKSCRKNSVIFMHDCIPTNLHLARRDMNDSRLASETDQPAAWAGDVWKAVAILKEFRPDLHIRAFDAEPTGLIAITNLNPLSNILEEKYFDITKKYSDLTLINEGNVYIEKLEIIPYRSALGFNAFSELFSA